MTKSRPEAEENAALELIRAYPLASLLGAAAAGFVLARIARRLR